MKKLIILISSLAIISLTSCNKAETLEIKNNISAKTVIEKNNKNITEDDEIIEEIPMVDNINIENVTSIEDETPMEDEVPIKDEITLKGETFIEDYIPVENNQSDSENIVNEDLPKQNIIIPVNEEDAINHKTDNTIYFFVSNSNADGFDIIETNVGTSNLKEVLDLAVNKYSLGSIPKGTVIKSAYVENRIAYINLNEFFAVDSQSGSSAYTYTKIYSIVNLAIYNKVFGVDKVVLSIENGITCIGPAIIPEFYTAKLFNKGTY